MKLVITDSRKVSQFSSILKNLKNFSLDIEIHVDDERLYAQGMDSSHCCLFELELLMYTIPIVLIYSYLAEKLICSIKT